MSTMRRPVVLVIRDGWGIASERTWDATFHAKTPNHDRIFARFGVSHLLCHGRHVGLPDGVMGNSEVGHTNLGAGRVVVQESLHIRQEVESGRFFDNETLKSVIEHCKGGEAGLHLMGLCSDGIVHSDMAHLEALLRMAAAAGLRSVFVHCFLDGRDTPPRSARPYLTRIRKWCAEHTGRVATVSGRYYAMDRDRRWERTRLAYEAIAEAGGRVATDALSALAAAYDRGESDEFVEPTIVSGYRGARERDGFIFFNFRADRARQITEALVLPDFSEFERRRFLDPVFASFTLYEERLPVPHAFHLPPVLNNLASVLSAEGVRQFRTAETEKYAHVTYFFNSGEEEPYPLEDRLLVPSPKVATYDLKPEMSACEVTDALVRRLGDYDFVVVNFANGDMVGHTGVFEAAIKAVEAVDDCVGRVVEEAFRLGRVVIITADHGNCECMRTEDGTPHTYHTTNPVHFCVADAEAGPRPLREQGVLADVAPTVLRLLGIEKPPEMTGRSMLL